MMLPCPSSRRRLSGKLKKLIDVCTLERKESKSRGVLGRGAIGWRRGSVLGLKWEELRQK